MSNKKVEALKKSAQEKKLIALQKTEKAIEILINSEQKITIASVARLAGVSTSYIYKYPELSYRIQTLKEQQKYNCKSSILPVNKNHQVTIKSRDRLVKLEQEKAELTNEIKMLKNSISNIINSDNSVEQLQANNIRLTVENQELKKQLERLEQEVYELRGFILGQGYRDETDQQVKSIKNKK